MINDTTSALTHSGVDKLGKERANLFLSNHRDITLDPAFVNYTLYHSGQNTVRIAIGDNLLTKPYVSDLMRLNKSFIVKRSATGVRAVFAAFKKLSAYILLSITEDRENIWIAQREGRAKDGRDKTEPAIIKMLSMNKPKNQDFSEYMASLNVVPVSISYEYDPCDYAKANELYEKQVSGSYEKELHEDVASIALGISGLKGSVHVSYGEVITGNFDDAEAFALEVDRQVIKNYVLHPSNYFAYIALYNHTPEGVYGSLQEPFDADRLAVHKNDFMQRVDSYPQHLRKIVLEIYANPILAKQEMGFMPARTTP